MPRPAPSVSRVVTLLNLLGDHANEFLTLSEIARRLDLNKATAHGILNALTDAGYVIRHPNDKGYSIGPMVVAVGRAAIAPEMELLALARHDMETIAEAAGGQCVAVVEKGNQLLVVALCGAPTGSVGIHLGARARPAPPFGFVFVAWASEARIEAWLTYEPLTDAERERFRSLLHTVRERGFSVATFSEDRERIEHAIQELLSDVTGAEVEQTLTALSTELAREESELAEIRTDRTYRVRQISAPVFDPEGTVRLALSLTGLPELSGAAIRDHGYALSVAASRLSKQFGERAPRRAGAELAPPTETAA